METIQQVERQVTTVRGIYFDPDERILLGIRPLSAKQRPGDADLIGGKVDMDEDSLTAVVRESSEEAGLTVSKNDLFLHYVERNQDGSTLFIREYYFCRKPVRRAEVNVMSEHEAFLWVLPRTALRLTSFIPHQRAISSLR